MREKDIRPDTVYEIEVGWEEPVLFSAQYDRVDFYEPLGAYILKFFHNEQFVNAAITEEFAFRLVRDAFLPLVKRDFLYQSEYELYQSTLDKNLEDWWDL